MLILSSEQGCYDASCKLCVYMRAWLCTTTHISVSDCSHTCRSITLMQGSLTPRVSYCCAGADCLTCGRHSLTYTVSFLVWKTEYRQYSDKHVKKYAVSEGERRSLGQEKPQLQAKSKEGLEKPWACSHKRVQEFCDSTEAPSASVCFAETDETSMNHES